MERAHWAVTKGVRSDQCTLVTCDNVGRTSRERYLEVP